MKKAHWFLCTQVVLKKLGYFSTTNAVFIQGSL